MATKYLANALSRVDWNGNVTQFLAHGSAAERMENAALRLAVWAKQFENIDKTNPALCFIRDMQVANQQVAALTALAIYKASASAIRATLESALYYTYFRTHPSELATLVRDPSYFVDKAEMLDYHKLHTAGFVKLQQMFGLVNEINQWYRETSAVLHAQIPGKWVTQKKLEEIAYNADTLKLVVKAYCTGEELVHRLFLCTVGRELWGGMSTPAKTAILHGLSGKHKKALGLDAA